MFLSDSEGSRSLALRALSRDGDVLTVEAIAADGDRRWRLAGPLLHLDEAAELGAWLAGLPGDLTLGADEWTTLTFASPVLSFAGRRVPGGVVELRVSVLGMAAAGGAPPETGPQQPGASRPLTTDVVLGLDLPAPVVERAAVAFVSETAALRA
ncbi:WapI family immunity protein [Leifsonia shinshuensis]|uniref:WapI family immunity protein n=1 Tax=Leifsonia shinshuensis TaxID=150026 RepID=UPI00162ACE5B|nr:hypothetical protein [Leifsonia shinshuensis]